MKEKKGYRFKNKDKGFISQRDYDALSAEKRVFIDEQLLKKNINKKEVLVPHIEYVDKSLFTDVLDDNKNILWAQNTKKGVALLLDPIVDHIASITHHSHMGQDYEKKFDKDYKPIYTQTLTIDSESEDLHKINRSLISKTYGLMKAAGIEDISLKGYRNFLFPHPKSHPADKDRLVSGRIMKIWKEPYFHTFFNTGTSNVNIEKLKRERTHALRSGRSKGLILSSKKPTK